MFVKIPSGRMILASPPFLRDLIIHSVNSDSIPLPPVVYALDELPDKDTLLLASVITAL